MRVFNKLIGFMKKWGFYDVYMVYLFGLRSIVVRDNEPQAHKQPLLCYRSVLCTPPFSTFNEMPKYRGIDNLNTTLHLIKNKFIKNQHKIVLNCDGSTNNFTNKQQINTHNIAQSLGRGCHQNKEILK